MRKDEAGGPRQPLHLEGCHVRSVCRPRIPRKGPDQPVLRSRRRDGKPRRRGLGDGLEERRWLDCDCNGGLFNLGHRNSRVTTAVREALLDPDTGNRHLMSGGTEHSSPSSSPPRPATAFRGAAFGVGGHGPLVCVVLWAGLVPKAAPRKRDLAPREGAPTLGIAERHQLKYRRRDILHPRAARSR